VVALFPGFEDKVRCLARGSGCFQTAEVEGQKPLVICLSKNVLVSSV
jgi:hypothetical protein